ncbi:MAG: GNAT family N-acetyltransferase [Thiobacillus sp.]|nr:GNAT family N-acetyltransferase [Thiobacillus sp.]
MPQLHSAQNAPPTPRYHLSLAVDDEEIREAQRLRHAVFVEEMGARLPPVLPGHDIDLYDPYCDHLIVRERDHGEVVGTYRILTPESALRLGSYFVDSQYDLARLAQLRPRMAELSRACVHPSHRGGAVIRALWTGIAEFMTRYRYDYIVGCAAIGMADGGRLAARVYREARACRLAPREWQCSPHNRLPVEELDDGLAAVLPPLIKGYLHAGAYVCSEPALDLNFNTAGLLMLLPMSQLKTNHANRFDR